MKAIRHPPKALAFLFALLLTLLPVTPLMAGMLDTGALLHAANANAERAMLVERLGSGEVRDTLARLGVDPADAEARVVRLTDSEVADLNARLEQLPAGGASTLEVVLIVFLVFVITDAIGLTDIFAFVQPSR
ncbi:MAG: PA2779 family protein [Thioalkalivibrio sp.]|nr:PA2779 family protein [Thioalkalivibrio sp.]